MSADEAVAHVIKPYRDDKLKDLVGNLGFGGKPKTDIQTERRDSVHTGITKHVFTYKAPRHPAH